MPFGEMTEVIKGRAAIYDYFSMIFAAPPGKIFIGLSERFLPAFEAMDANTETLKKYVDNENKFDSEKALHIMNTNYTAIFYAGVQSVPTSESVYRSSARLVKQEPWEEVMAFYHIRKYKKPEQIREPEDHISIELDFMKFMCDLSLYMIENSHEDKLEAALQEQQRFLNEHLLKWVQSFCGNVLGKSKYDELGLYTAAASLLPVFLDSEAELLDYLLN